MSLCEFSWNFCDFRSIFRAFKQFLDFSGIVFALKINSKKTKPSFLGRARRPDPLRPASAPVRQPGPSKPIWAQRHGHGVPRPGVPGHRPPPPWRARPGYPGARAPIQRARPALQTLAGRASPCSRRRRPWSHAAGRRPRFVELVASRS
jgi:hypothetical protein